MSYWPRLQLTSSEQQRWAVYSQPGKAARAVLYRAYAGELRITTTTPEDAENIQISRRARVFAMTASGDVHNVEIAISDSSGEQYTMGFTPMTNLLMGLNADPRGMAIFGGQPTWAQNAVVGFPLGAMVGSPGCVAPHVFEPNIVLAPNQTLNIKGRALLPTRTLIKQTAPDVDNSETAHEEVVHLSFTLHAWEFPIE